MSRATQQRRQRILTEIFEKKHVTVKHLASGMDVSEATVRRDLRSLADEDQLTLVYGGATLPRNRDYSFQAKSQRNVEAKQAIGNLASSLVTDGDQIFLDSGTTCFEMTTHLRSNEGVSILATSVRLALELDWPGLDVILMGGQYRPARMDTVGPVAVHTLDQLRGYRAFVGADGLSQDFGPSASDIQSAHLHQMVLRNARDVVLLVDHSKFEEPSLFRIATWDQIDRIITDRRPAQPWIEFMQKNDIELMLPEEYPED